MNSRLLILACLLLAISSATHAEEAVPDFARQWSQGRAVGKGPVRFTHSPMRLEDIKSIVPYGLMVGGHVCPIDHGYFFSEATRTRPAAL